MAYWFAGYFAKPPLPVAGELPPGGVRREIDRPFRGVGVLVPSLYDADPPADGVRELARQLGFGPGTDWLFLRYVTWAGVVERVSGLGVCDGREFGPLSVAEPEGARETFLLLMAKFGVSAADALRFPPFERGFWGEQ